jgi:hypothetical protein
MLRHLLIAAVLAGLPGLPPIYHGRSNQLAVDAPRLEADVRVDGYLDEDVWASAAILTGFSQYQPVDGLPAADSTEVLVWYGQHAMYFGVRAYEPHGVVSASLADRDRLGNDDVIQILLDTFNDRRRALVFGVNPLGVQLDGTWTEGAGHALDTNPDFLYDSKGHVTEWGYEVEIRIPFKSIRYQPGDVQTWGINVIRQVRHSGYQQTWTPVRQGRASFLDQSGTLEGLSELRRGLVLDINPVVTSKAEGTPDAVGAWSYDADRPEFGANVRWGIKSCWNS